MRNISRQLAIEAVKDKEAMQKVGELARFIDYMLGRPPLENILEIGGMYGGTAWVWDQISENESKIVTIDAYILGGRMEHAPEKVILINADSREQSTLDQVKEHFNSVDFLFIDGNHSYEAVSRDFQLYSPLVKRGGTIALHDTAVDIHEHGIMKFWREITPNYEHFQIFDPIENSDWGGIGVLCV